MNLSKPFGALVVALALSGCATGPKFAEVKGSIPALSTESGRVFFYRSANPIGAGIQPDVKLNGKVVGSSKPGGFFFVDTPPGDYEVVLSTETDKKLTFALAKGQQRCVRMSVGLGVVVYRVYPELAERATCDAEIEGLSYIGSALGTK